MESLDNIIELFPGRHRRLEGITFKELADRWLSAEGKRRVCPENEVRHVAHLASLWDMTEPELRPRAIKRALADLSEKLGPSTLNKVRATGRRIIKEAMLNDEWEGPNPFDVVDRVKETRPTYRTLSLTEVRAILPHLSHYRRREALFMLYLGPRPGEMKGLKKCDVDLARRVVVIRRSNGRDRTKTGKERAVPISDSLLPVLQEAIAESPCEFVFPKYCRGTGPQRHDVKLARVLRDPLRKAGLVTAYKVYCNLKGCGFLEEWPRKPDNENCPKCDRHLLSTGIPIKLRFYDLRHSAATLHREAGADPLAVQLALGHSPETLTDSVYTHLSMEYLSRELSKLAI